MFLLWLTEQINLTHATLFPYVLPGFHVPISTVAPKERIRWQLAGGILVLARTSNLACIGRFNRGSGAVAMVLHDEAEGPGAMISELRKILRRVWR